MRRIFYNIKTRIIIVGLILISLLIGSCNTQKIKIDKKNLIPQKELVSLLVDIYLADGLLNIPKIKSRFSSLDSITSYYQIIEKHGFTKERMDKTIQYYFVKDPKELNKIYDQVLGILSAMEVHVQNDYRTEQIHILNIWPGKDFYALPSLTGIDSVKFDFPLTNPGTYTLSFTSILYPDDQSVNPKASVYLVARDSLETGKRKYFKSVEYLKDGRPHLYTMVFIAPHNNMIQLRGCLFDSQNTGIWNHFRIENIMLTLSQVAL